MKMLLTLLVSLISFGVMASSGETKTFVYNGTQDSVELLLRGEETHTEYRTEQRRATCSRTVMAGYRTICTGGGPQRPRQCHSHPVYRTEYYPCWQTVSIPYEVKDYDVEAKVNLDVSKLAHAETSGETFKLILNGPNLALEAVGSKKFFLVLKKQEAHTQVRGNVKYVHYAYSVELIEAAPVVKALNMTSISLEDNILKVIMGPVGGREHLGFSLSVARVRLIGSDPVLFDRELTASEVEFNTMGAGSVAGVNVDRLGIDLNGGKFRLTTTAFFKHRGSRVINAAQFSELEVSRTLIYTNR